MYSGSMVQLEIRCPICSLKGKIEINEDATKDASRGLLAVNIVPGMVCEHQFVAYLDKNLKVRDALTADFHIELAATPEPKKEIESKPSIDIIDMDLIKINLTPQIITYVISAVFTKKKIVLISEETHLFNHFQNFFKYITKDSFGIDLTFITLEDYMNRKAEFQEAIVLGRNEILRDSDGVLNSRKLKTEKGFVDAFFKERDLKVSMIVLKNEIQKAFNLCTGLKELFGEYKAGDTINLKEIRSRLEDIHNIKISQSYLDFLTTITQSYFNLLLEG